jgi:SAM dependent carboxyl methyltransferase
MTATGGMADDYDAHSEYQRAVADAGTDRIRSCVAAVSVAADEPFVVADFGCSTGANSMAAVSTAIDAVRARHADQAVVALHNDLPTNDWNQLFANVTGARTGRVLHLASAVSFFEPATPTGSVHLGMSFSAAHWLREPPTVVVPEGFYFSEATGAARAALATQAEDDWTTFLIARAADVHAGGRLLVQMVGTDASGNVTARRLLQAMADVAAGMAEEGLVGHDAVDHYVLPVYARTVDEARAPLGRAAVGFSEVECRTDPVANPYFTRWQADGDAGRYATAYTAFVRGFTESSLRDHLFDGVEDPERALADFFGRLSVRFRDDPERDRFDDWTLTVVLARE